MAYTPLNIPTGTTVTAADMAYWETQYACVFDSSDKTVSGNFYWATTKQFGWSDGYWARVGANSIKFWNGSALGSIQAGTVSDSVGTMAALRASIPAAVTLDMIGGRLTLESGVAVSTTDQLAKTTLYYTPDKHNVISLYDGASAWATVVFAELSISLAGLTASKPYDVFCYNNAGTATLELLVWTDATSRATALVKQDGRWVKTGATTRRYLGTIYINASGGQCDDSYAFRYVWNANNRVIRPMRVIEATASWSYNNGGWRQANAATANQLDFIVGLPDVRLFAHVNGMYQVAAGGTQSAVSIGLDSTSAPATGALSAAASYVSNMSSCSATLQTYPGIGRHRAVWIESSSGLNGSFLGNPTAYPWAASGEQVSGIDGETEG